MFKFMPQVKKIWIYGAAAGIIIASSSTMAYALNNNIPENASASVVSSANVPKENNQTPASNLKITAEYKVVDQSKITPDLEHTKALLTDKLSVSGKDITPEQVEEKSKLYLANTIPGDKDISAEQAAAYAATILKKAYGVNFTGYTADTSFSRSNVPNSDNWTVIFHAPNEDKSSKRYLASVNSVSGSMLNASLYDFTDSEVDSKNVHDPEWMKTAEAAIAKLMPENVSITRSKVVAATSLIGVMVVSELSDGSACAVRLSGENKEAIAYQYFPNGYDGSWDYHPVTANGVG
jgi:hypothetical protein